ncbi:MAG TPA: response regulator [Bryobacteraceae bacterium]|nr:response regulator [Bryobacteraceae bacterium]
MDSLFASGSWSGIWVESGSNQNPERDRPLDSPSQSNPDSAKKRRQILIVEDNRADVFLIRESLERAQLEADLHVVHDGDKAIRFLEAADLDPRAPIPDLIILDINLPKRSGREVIRRMRQSFRCSHALVVVVTSSDSERDREEVGKFGINAYFRKPSEYASFMKLGEVVNGLLNKA